MSRRDLVGMIADARARMMLRGHHRLKIEIGPETLIELGVHRQTVMSWPEIRAYERNDDVEGFVLRPISD